MKKLDDYSFYGMFSNCKSIENMPIDLSIESVNDNSCNSMFENCSSLLDSGNINCSVISSECFKNMFKNCSSLNHIYVTFLDWNEAEKSTLKWVSNVSGYGIFKCDYRLKEIVDDSHIPIGWRKKIFGLPELTFRSIGNETAKMKLAVSGNPDQLDLSAYWYDNQNIKHTVSSLLEDYVNLSSDIDLNVYGNTKYFSKDENNYYYFDIISGKAGCSGSIQYLLSENSDLDLMTENCFINLFKNQINLISTPLLSSYVLSSGCYQSMFEGCEGLSAMPALNNQDLADKCYKNMFKDCVNISTSIELPASEMKPNCYEGIFENCVSLIEMPKLNSTNLASGCYKNMFNGCCNLISSVELPASEMKQNCYEGMFENCSLLEKTPELISKNLSSYCYKNMFKNCFSLSSTQPIYAENLDDYCCASMFENCISLKNSPTLRAGTLTNHCYEEMFKGCLNLMSLNVKFTKWDEDNAISSTFNWVSGIYTQSGDFIHQENLPITSDLDDAATEKYVYYNEHRIPSGWRDTPNDYDVVWDLTDKTDILSFTLADNEDNANIKFVFKSDDNITSANFYKVFGLDYTDTYSYSYLKDDGNYVFDFFNIESVKNENGYYAMKDPVFYWSYDLIHWRKYKRIISYFTNDYNGVLSTNENDEYLITVDCDEIHLDRMHNKIYFCGNLVKDYNIIGNPFGINQLRNTLTISYTVGGNDLFVKHCPIYDSKSKSYININIYNNFEISDGKVNCSGKLNYLIYESSSSEITTKLKNYFTYYKYSDVLNHRTFVYNTDSHFQYLFKKCANLLSAPTIVNNSVANGCLGMFEGCSSLKEFKQQLSTSTYFNCYKEMFKDCTSLSSVYKSMLPAIYLYPGAYYGMFQGCTSLTVAPYLPTPYLMTYKKSYPYGSSGLGAFENVLRYFMSSKCYNYMFDGCDNIKDVYFGFKHYCGYNSDSEWKKYSASDYRVCTYNCVSKNDGKITIHKRGGIDSDKDEHKNISFLRNGSNISYYTKGDKEKLSKTEYNNSSGVWQLFKKAAEEEKTEVSDLKRYLNNKWDLSL